MKFSRTLRVDLNTVSFTLPVVKTGATKFMHEYNTAKLNFVICGSFSYRLALRSLRLTACGP